MTLENIKQLKTDVLSIELWRREHAGLPAHQQLVRLSDAALRQELAERHFQIEHVAWFPPNDDRRDPLCTPNLAAPVMQRVQRSCYLIGAGAVHRAGPGKVQLHHLNYGEANSLCDSEPFRCQPSVVERHGESYGGYGYSGYLLGRRHILTCWHGWDYFSHDTQVAIFGHHARAACDNPTTLPERCVYAVKPYPVAYAPATPEANGVCPGDWVVLELQRPVDHLPDVARPTIGMARVGMAVYTLGYPCGLPLKLADGATVLSIGSGDFRADLDTFDGNSGSPVFDAQTHTLLGIIVEAQKGEGDFEPSPALHCYVGNRIDSRIIGQRAVAASCFAAAVLTGR